MSENFISNVESIFKGMDGFVNSKTVMGDPIKVEKATVIPLIDVSCGMASGNFVKSGKDSSAGGMATRLSPVALLVIDENGATKLINIKNQDTMTKILDMVPDVLKKFTKGEKTLTPKAEAGAKKIAEEQKDTFLSE